MTKAERKLLTGFVAIHAALVISCRIDGWASTKDFTKLAKEARFRIDRADRRRKARASRAKRARA